MAETISFTEQEIANWMIYERVRKGGKFNMFDPRAQGMSRLSSTEYGFCMKNYSNLKIAAEAEKEKLST